LQPQIIIHLSSRQQGIEPQQRKTPQPAGSTVEQSKAFVSATQPIAVVQPSRADSQLKFPLVQTASLVAPSRSTSPLRLGGKGLIATNQSVSERVNGWGGVSISFLSLTVELGIFFADLKKWSFAADRGRFRAVDTQRFVLSIDGVIQ